MASERTGASANKQRHGEANKILYRRVEISSELSETDGGVGPDRSLVVSRLQSCKVLHQFVVQVVVVQLGSEQQHPLHAQKTDCCHGYENAHHVTRSKDAVRRTCLKT